MNQPALPVAELTSYWGATCTYTFSRTGRVDVPLTACVLQLLETCPHYISRFKVQLLSLAMANEEQVEHMARLAGIEGPYTINRRALYLWLEAANHSAFTVWYDGRIEACDEQGKSLAFNPAPIIAYAKRAGLYWPGTLAEEFVEITPGGPALKPTPEITLSPLAPARPQPK